MNLPKHAVKNILKKNAIIRISDKATEEILKEANKEIENITKKAKTASLHAGRKTITKEDIDFVAGEAKE